MAELTKELLDELGQLQSCAVANAIETFDVRPRNEGFMSPEVRCMFPELGGMIGYAVTGVIRAGRAPTTRMQVSRLDWVDEVLKVPEPRVIVLQDLDAPNPVGSFWGEVQSNVHRALGCVGTVTDGGVRDLDEMRALNFRAFASQPLVSHAYVHLVDANVPVTVGGLTVNTGDLILGDQHGVTNIPMDIAAEVPAEVRRLEASEREMIDVCQAPDFTVDKLKAMIRSRYYAGSEPQKDTVDILREIRDSLNRTLRRNAPPQGRRRATAAARPAPNRRARRMVADSEGRQVARVDYIRELAGQGLTRGQIARQLEVPYQTVYAATRRITVRSAAEARAEARAQAAEADDTAEESQQSRRLESDDTEA